MIKKSDKTALVFGNQKINYTTLLSNIDFYSTLITGDQDTRIAIFSENRLEWVYAFYAIWKNDAVPVTIDFLSKPKEVAYILNDCKPKYVFVSQNNLGKLQEAISLIDHKPTPIVFDDVEIVNNEPEPDNFPEPPDDNIACIIYSSGTTGDPKGVLLSFENIRVNIKSVSVDAPIVDHNQVMLAMLPLHHVLPLVGTVLCPLYCGAKVAFTPSLDPADIVKTLNDNAVTIIISVPRFYSMLFKGIKDKIDQKLLAKLLFKIASKVKSKRFSKKLFKTVHDKFGGHVDYILTGGAAIEKNIEEGFATLGFEILSGYGMTEAAPLIAFPRPGATRYGSVGRPLDCNEVKIASDGEILTRGPNVMKGYYNLPDKTSDTIINGWLHTGDLGYIDDEGFLFITGRKKEIIVLPNGKNINPVLIEKEILKMSNCINEIGVFMHENKLQMVCSPDSRNIQERGIKDFKKFVQDEIVLKYNDNCAPHKQIKKITIVDEELPKTRLDKLKRFKLKDLVPTISDKEKKYQGHEPSYKEYSVIKDFMNQQMEKKIFPDDHLEFDLGMDSLDKVSLQTFVKNNFGIDLQEIHLKKYPTVHKLSEFIKNNSQKLKNEAINLTDIFKEKVNIKLPKSSHLHIFLRNTSRFFLKMFFRVEINNIDKIPSEPCIITPNHQSFLDGFLVASDLNHTQLKKTYFLAKAKHISNWFIRSVAKVSNVIVVDISNDLKTTLQKLATAIRKNKNIIIFPEGTRSYDGQINEFKKTFAILSKELNIPVVPVAIDGAYKVLPRGKRFPKFGSKITVSYLDPIYPANKDVELIKDETEKLIKNKVKI